MVHPITINSRYSGYLASSAITWQDSGNSFLRVKASQVSCILMYLKGEFVTLILKASVQIVNFGPHAVRVGISTTGLEASVSAVGSTVTVLTSGNVMDENSFSHPKKVINNLSLASEWPIKCLAMFQKLLLLWGSSESSACLLTTVQVVPVKNSRCSCGMQPSICVSSWLLTRSLHSISRWLSPNLSVWRRMATSTWDLEFDTDIYYQQSGSF